MSKNIFKELKRWNICHCLLSQLAAALLNVPLCHHAANLPPGRLEVAFTHTQTHLDKAQVAGNVAINNTQGVTDSWRETLCVAVCVCECVIVFIMPERPSCHHLTRLLRWTHSIFYAHTRAPNPTQTQRTCVSNPQSVCVHKNTQRFKGKRCYNCPGPLSSKLWTHTLSLREFANLWVFDELWILCVCVCVCVGRSYASFSHLNISAFLSIPEETSRFASCQSSTQQGYYTTAYSKWTVTKVPLRDLAVISYRLVNFLININLPHSTSGSLSSQVKNNQHLTANI